MVAPAIVAHYPHAAPKPSPALLPTTPRATKRRPIVSPGLSLRLARIGNRLQAVRRRKLVNRGEHYVVAQSMEHHHQHHPDQHHQHHTNIAIVNLMDNSLHGRNIIM